MCGIVGFVKHDCINDLYNGLKMLEYRGYDSAGIAYMARGRLVVKKRKGRIEGLRRYCHGVKTDIGLGHTRWATHGTPSHANAHPHTAGNFALVHNGIIANCQALRADLARRGCRFVSHTDTEVIVQLLALEGASCRTPADVLAATYRTIAALQGSFAVAFLCSATPHCLYLFKQDNPLIVGQGEGFYCFASDTPAIVAHTNRIYKMQDGDVAILRADGADFWHNGVSFCPRFVTTYLDAAQVSKGQYSTYMRKEMAEIPLTMQRTQAALAQASFPIGDGDLHFVGCGTAYHACLYAADLLTDVRRAYCWVGSEFAAKLSPRDTVVAVSQSGETADTIRAARLALAQGAGVVAVTNVPYSGLSTLAHTTLLTRAGAEIAVAATKSYNAQLVALHCLCARLAPLPAAVDWYTPSTLVYNALGGLDRCASRGYDAVFILGRGRDYHTCMEGCLKIKEIAYCRCETEYSGEIKHGPLACVTARSLVVLVCTQRADVDNNRNALSQVATRGAATLVVTNCDALAPLADYVFRLPDAPDSVMPALAVQPLQYLAYRMALRRRLDPDKPRHLAKSVTVQ